MDILPNYVSISSHSSSLGPPASLEGRIGLRDPPRSSKTREVLSQSQTSSDKGCQLFTGTNPPTAGITRWLWKLILLSMTLTWNLERLILLKNDEALMMQTFQKTRHWQNMNEFNKDLENCSNSHVFYPCLLKPQHLPLDLFLFSFVRSTFPALSP